jgi:hypothetical protein
MRRHSSIFNQKSETSGREKWKGGAGKLFQFFTPRLLGLGKSNKVFDNKNRLSGAFARVNHKIKA